MEQRLFELLNPYNPSNSVLLDVLNEMIDDSILLEIANAHECGKSEECLQALRRIRDDAVLPELSDWQAMDVIGLIRFSEPDIPNWKPSGHGTRGHLMRAFCCAVLLRLGADRERRADGEFNGENPTLMNLIPSAWSLGHAVEEAALSFISSRLLTSEIETGERPFFAFSVLLLRIRLDVNSKHASEVKLLASWVEEEEKAAKQILKISNEKQWLFSLTYFNAPPWQKRWQDLGREMLLERGANYPEETQLALQQLGHRLLANL